jgi:exodeoxyribonuclease-5
LSREVIDLSLVCHEGPLLLRQSPAYVVPKDGVQLTSEQTSAIEEIIKALKKDPVLIALAGPAGSGKTTMIRELSERLEGKVVISALTNKAVDVLRQKNIADAMTVHSACLMPVFHQPGASLYTYFNMEDPDDETIEYLHKHFDAQQLERARNAALRYGLNSGARILGIKDFLEEYLWYWETKTKGEEVLIVDEASMLGADLLKKIQRCYSKIILVGDDFQLPPVKDLDVFKSDKLVDTRVRISEIHRQKKFSQPLVLSQAVRAGNTVPFQPVAPIDLNQAMEGVPVIVWTNAVRISITRKIRKALGYSGLGPQPGESIVCRDTHTIDGTYFVKNSIWKVLSINERGECNLQSAHGGRTKQPVRLWMEEYGAGTGLLCRYSYAITCHTAQGSEWSTVMIHANEAAKHIRSNRKQGRMWLYTAITRAKQEIKWVNSEITSPSRG